MKYFYLNFVSLLFLISCSENNDNVTVNETSSKPSEQTINCVANDGILVFNDVKDYDNAIAYLASIGDENLNVWESKLNFKSYRAVNEINDSAFICDAVLGSLINPEGKVVIGNYLFKLNSSNKNIEVFSYNSQLKSSNLLEVSEPDVNLVQKYFFSEEYSQDSITCAASNLKGFISNDKEGYYPFSGATGASIKSKVVYQAVGIYFSLQAKIKYINKAGCNGWVNIGLESSSDSYYQQNKGITGIFKKTPSAVSIPQKYYFGNCNEYNYRPYERSTSLRSYYYCVRFFYTDNNTGEANEGTLSIRK